VKNNAEKVFTPPSRWEASGRRAEGMVFAAGANASKLLDAFALSQPLYVR
jgi:hypothetical protein